MKPCGHFVSCHFDDQGAELEVADKVENLSIVIKSLVMLDTLSPKTSGTLKRNKGRMKIVNIDLRETLREYNWGVTTNYF